MLTALQKSSAKSQPCPVSARPEIQKIAVSYEPDILITERKRRSLKKAPVAAGHAPHDHKEHHHRDAECGCGHDHHEHEEHHHHDAECGCGHDHHDHEEHHHHDAACACEHDHHDHEEHHHHDEACGCGHDHHEHEEHHHHVPGHPADCQCELCRHGDRIPLDGVIVEGESRIDTSPVTGEPVPVKAGYGDEVVSGCVNTSGLLKMRVEKVLEESMVTRILDSVENAAASKPKIDRFITRFSRIYTPFVVGLAILTAVVPSLVTGDWYYWIYTAITFLVISCPCALVLSVPLAFFSGIGAGSKRGILFKGGVSIEGIKNIAAVVMDKTGTITEGNFVVQ